jgi:hypothetical protein
MTSISDLASIVNKLATAVQDGEQVVVPLLSARLEKLATSNPDDQTVVAMYRVISKLEDNKKNFISRALLKDLYTKHYTRGTKFAEYFADELGTLPEAPKPVVAPKQTGSIDPYVGADPVLANALASVFDESMPLKMFSKTAGERAVKMVATNLGLWNLKPAKLDVVSGNEKFLVVQADYDTPKGRTSVFVPVELAGDKVMAPVVFMANAGPQELNNGNLKGYLTKNAGARLDVKASDIIEVLTKAVAKESAVSAVDMALVRMKTASSVQAPFFADSILGQKLDPVVKNAMVEIPKAGQFASFAEKFETPLGVANFKFGVDKVNAGREIIARALKSFGLTAARMAVSGVANDAVVYAVSLVNGGTAFNVPVKIEGGLVNAPTVFICNGSVAPFTKTAVSKVLTDGQTDTRAAAATSPQYRLKNSELIDNIRNAVAEENYTKAEDALNVLAEQDAAAYKTGLGVYMAALTDKPVLPKCSMVIASKTSSQPICGHTGLPLNKVYQDKNGVCAPLYHRELNENYTPAKMSSYKVFGG